MTLEEFSTNVRAVMDLILEKDKNLNEETARHWDEVATRSYLFDRNAKQAAAVEALTPATLLEFYDRHFSGGGQGRRKLSTWVYGNQFKVGEEGAGGGRKGGEGAEGGEGGEGEGEGEKTDDSSSSIDNGSSSGGGSAREVIVVENYYEFKRSMPLLPMRKVTHPVSTAAVGSSKL